MRGLAPELQQSYDLCVSITNDRAKNFSYPLKRLPQDRFQAICAIYAFARKTDDISDGSFDEEADPENNAVQVDGKVILSEMKKWRQAFDNAMAGDPSGDPMFPAVADTLERYKIPAKYMEELIIGCEMDATVQRYETWKETRLYCYRVASVVGIMTLYTFGFSEKPNIPQPQPDPDTLDAAERLGIAFQMTNILRDIAEDGQRNRIYLPLEDLKKFEVPEEDLLQANDSPKFRELVMFEANRALELYKATDELIPKMSEVGSNALYLLSLGYRSLLDKIISLKGDVLTKRVSLTTTEKIKLAARGLFG